MEKEEKAKIYVARLKQCLSAVKLSVICAIVAVGALFLFMAISAGIGLKDSNINGYMLGIVITASLALAGVVAALISMLIAVITLKIFKKLDIPEDEVE